MSTVLAQPVSALPSRFGYLMGLYAENYQRLLRLFAPQRLSEGCYRSRIDDGLDVRVQVLERHPYTVDLDLSYVAVDGETGQPSPSAQVRLYLDARVAEAMHCEPGRRLWEVLSPLPTPRGVVDHRMRMASFLSRWLEYLAEQGHSLATLEREAGTGDTGPGVCVGGPRPALPKQT